MGIAMALVAVSVTPPQAHARKVNFTTQEKNFTALQGLPINRGVLPVMVFKKPYL